MSEGAALVTGDGVICYCNPQFAALTGGTTVSALVGQALRDLVPSDAAFTIDAMLQRARRGPARIEVGLVPRDGGGVRAVQLTASATSVSDVEVLCIVATDLTEQREALTGMEVRERLISNAGHELRAPMQDLVSEVEVLLAQYPASTIEQLQSIQRLGIRLAGLVGNLLDVRRLGSDELEVPTKGFVVELPDG
jgi:PAS domain S-box-containing protein